VFPVPPSTQARPRVRRRWGRVEGNTRDLWRAVEFRARAQIGGSAKERARCDTRQTVLPGVTFTAVELGNTVVDAVRRRVQQDTLGHRGYAGDPLFTVWRLLLRGREHLTDKDIARLDAGIADR